MILVNTFEDPFGDICGKGGVWCKLSGKAAFSMGRNVVALASFNGDITMMCHLLLHPYFDYN